ncbi:MAG: hypothetical protein CL771_07035 [Chloroflexi bacterium]|nr:hypothetical protein [Chloroflexota bacterium]|tara:strand:+ start:3784 stop:4665 length:882 start_codon:yes stop_codon:yes gene_type:complete
MTQPSRPEDHTASAYVKILTEWGQEFVNNQQWDEIRDRATLLLVTPTHQQRDIDLGNDRIAATYWLILERETLRWAPDNIRTDLQSGQAVVQQYGPSVVHPDSPLTHVTILRDDAASKILTSIPAQSRTAMEARWHIPLSTSLHDPLRRFDRLKAEAGSHDAREIERCIKHMWIAINGVAQSLSGVTHQNSMDFTLLAGELAGNILRIGSALEHSSHPMAEYLTATSGNNPTGRITGSWIQMLLSSDETDRAQAQRAIEGILREVRGLLAVQYRGRDWLQSPTADRLRVQSRS